MKSGGRARLCIFQTTGGFCYINRSLTFRHTAGDRSLEAITLDGIGNVYASLGDMQKTLDFYNQALPRLRAVGVRSREAETLGDIARAKRALGRFDEARSYA